MRLLAACLAILGVAISLGLWSARRAERAENVAPEIQAVTVQIKAGDTGWGTGVLVQYRGSWAVLTAAHVALSDRCEAIEHKEDGTTDRYSLTLEYANVEYDLAIMLPVGAVRRPSQLAALGTETPPAGARVFHCGGQYGEMTFSTGIVGTPHSSIAGRWHVKLSDVAAPGSSGGGIFDRRCRLLGIVTRVRAGMHTWAVPIAAAQPLLDGDPT